MNTTFKDFTDDTNANIVGEFLTQCFVTYEGRKQGPSLYVKDDSAAKILAQAYIDNQRKEFGAAFDLIYPNKSWAIKFV